ncbi:MAG: aminotransferase class V-fold PLP-dependent enzyme [Clostridia bacterium]|nr:aminotransferase class V-fold PLP-dependent enzyme [Clostridia bacterium]
MKAPICDFVRDYCASGGVRLHMPGHKGRSFLGMEEYDITEISGADVLYRARGIIRESEENAARLFGAERTLYSTEGSSLCIRAMLRLVQIYAKKKGLPLRIAAGRNAHKTLLDAAALLDAQVEWLYPEQESGPVACRLTGADVERQLNALTQKPSAVYITSPDYLGNISDIADIAAVCHRQGVLLLVDDAHGAYLRFLPEDRHPISLGADLCCDSAHKTLPALTGGAYLHLAHSLPDYLKDSAERALSLFASTSPSYLILQSLDRTNGYLAEGYREKLNILAGRMALLKQRLRARGYGVLGDEAIKLTLAPKGYGYSGDALHDALRKENIECEFSDPDYLVAMATPENDSVDLEKLERVLCSLPRRKAIDVAPPTLPRPEMALSIRQALLAPQKEMPVADCLGRVLGDASVSCPPAVPILICGERIDEDAIRCFQYYGIERCCTVDE